MPPDIEFQSLLGHFPSHPRYTRVRARAHVQARAQARFLSASCRFAGTELSNAKVSSVYCALTVRQSPIGTLDSYLFRGGVARETLLSFYSSD